MSAKTRLSPGGMPTPDDINATMDEVVRDLRAEHWAPAIEGIRELAHWYKTAGANAQTFNELCLYMERESLKQLEPGTKEYNQARLEIGKQIRLALSAPRPIITN